MKKIFFSCAAVFSSFVLSASLPEASVNIDFTGGDFSKIKDLSANKCKVSVVSQEKLAWTEENGEKILTFTGNNNQPRGIVLVAPPANFKLSNGFTIYFKLKTPSGHNQRVRNQFCQFGYGADKISGFSMFLYWKALHCRYGSDSKTTVASKAKADLIKADTWYDTAMVYDGKSITLYLNGKAVSSSPAVIPEVKNNFAIGATANRGGGYVFKGLIKNMKLYEKVFTEEEVAKIK